MQELSAQDLFWIRSRLPSAVLRLIGNSRKPVPLMLSGGFIRSCIANEPIQDIDLFCESQVRAQTLALGLANRPGCRMVTTDNAYTVLGLTYPVQFIHRWTFATPQDVIASFDFTIARAAMWAEWCQAYKRVLWRSACDDRFYPDLAAKRLVYCSPVRNEDAGGSLLRVLKFYQRGYRIPLDSLGAVIARLDMAIDRNQEAAKREQGLAFIYSGLLREVDPSIDPDHIAHLPGATSGDGEAIAFEPDPEPAVAN